MNSMVLVEKVTDVTGGVTGKVTGLTRMNTEKLRTLRLIACTCVINKKTKLIFIFFP